MQLLIISSLKCISRYIWYFEASIAIRIVSWGECIIAALVVYIYIVMEIGQSYKDSAQASVYMFTVAMGIPTN